MKNYFLLHHKISSVSMQGSCVERSLVAQTTVVLVKGGGLNDIFFKLWT